MLMAMAAVQFFSFPVALCSPGHEDQYGRTKARLTMISAVARGLARRLRSGQFLSRMLDSGYDRCGFCEHGVRRRNQQMEAFCTAWLKIIGYMVDVNRDALQVYLLTIHCVDTVAMRMVTFTSRPTAQKLRSASRSVYHVKCLDCVRFVIVVHIGLLSPTPVLCNFYRFAQARFMAKTIYQTATDLYLCPASLRSCTSVRALLPLTYATIPTTPAAGRVWNRVQL